MCNFNIHSEYKMLEFKISLYRNTTHLAYITTKNFSSVVEDPNMLRVLVCYARDVEHLTPDLASEICEKTFVEVTS